MQGDQFGFGDFDKASTVGCTDFLKTVQFEEVQTEKCLDMCLRHQQRC